MIFFKALQAPPLSFQNRKFNSAFCILRQIAFGLFVGGYFGACDTSNKTDKLDYQWSIHLHQHSEIPAVATYPYLSERGALLLWAAPDSVPKALCLDLKKGQITWQQALIEDSVFVPYYNLRMYSDKTHAYVPSGNTVYAIRWTDGEITQRWSIPGSLVETVASGPLGNLFLSSNDWSLRRSCVYKIDPKHNNTTLLFSLLWPNEHIAFFQAPLALSDGIILAYTVQNQTNRRTYSRWAWIDKKTGKVIREGQAYPDNSYGFGPTKPPIACGSDIILVAYDHIVRLDPESGKERWRLVMPRDMLTSQPLLEAREGSLYAALEDGYLYSINMENGQVCWKTRVSGTPSRMVACGRYVFVVGGGDGLLHWVEKETGRAMPSIKAPNHDFVRSGHFHRFIGVDCKKRLMLLFDGRSVRAYQIPR